MTISDHTRREREALERERLRLNPVVDAVIAYKPKPKSKPARKRARRAKKIAKGAESRKP